MVGLRAFSIYPSLGLNWWHAIDDSLMYSAQDRPVIYADGRCWGRLDQFQPDTVGESGEEKWGGEEGGEWGEGGGEGGRGDAGACLKLPHPDWPGLLQHHKDGGWQEWFFSAQETFKAVLKAWKLSVLHLLHHLHHLHLHLLIHHIHLLFPPAASLPLPPDPGRWSRTPNSGNLSEQASLVSILCCHLLQEMWNKAINQNCLVLNCKKVSHMKILFLGRCCVYDAKILHQPAQPSKRLKIKISKEKRLQRDWK